MDSEMKFSQNFRILRLKSGFQYESQDGVVKPHRGREVDILGHLASIF